jgi:hypothetical protein
MSRRQDWPPRRRRPHGGFPAGARFLNSCLVLLIGWIVGTAGKSDILVRGLLAARESDPRVPESKYFTSHLVDSYYMCTGFFLLSRYHQLFIRSNGCAFMHSSRSQVRGVTLRPTRIRSWSPPVLSRAQALAMPSQLAATGAPWPSARRRLTLT